LCYEKLKKKYFISMNILYSWHAIPKYLCRFYDYVKTEVKKYWIQTIWTESWTKKGTKIVCARPEEGSVVALRATGGSSNDPILPEPA